MYSFISSFFTNRTFINYWSISDIATIGIFTRNTNDQNNKKGQGIQIFGDTKIYELLRFKNINNSNLNIITNSKTQTTNGLLFEFEDDIRLRIFEKSNDIFIHIFSISHNLDQKYKLEEEQIKKSIKFSFGTTTNYVIQYTVPYELDNIFIFIRDCYNSKIEKIKSDTIYNTEYNHTD